MAHLHVWQHIMLATTFMPATTHSSCCPTVYEYTSAHMIVRYTGTWWGTWWYHNSIVANLRPSQGPELAMHHAVTSVQSHALPTLKLVKPCHFFGFCKQGADLWARDNMISHSTPIHLAVKAGHTQVIYALLDHALSTQGQQSDASSRYVSSRVLMVSVWYITLAAAVEESSNQQ